MSNALKELAVAADEIADDQRRIARAARSMERLRDRGWSWSKIVDGQRSPTIVDLLRRSGRRLSDATARFTRALAAELGEEGESHRQIGRRLGVTRQRVSAVVDEK